VQIRLILTVSIEGEHVAATAELPSGDNGSSLIFIGIKLKDLSLPS
jgi:hypothetical protein